MYPTRKTAVDFKLLNKAKTNNKNYFENNSIPYPMQMNLLFDTILPDSVNECSMSFHFFKANANFLLSVE